MVKFIFDHAYPKVIVFLNLHQDAKIQFILEIQSILEFHTQTGHTQFWPCPLKNLLIKFSLCEFVSPWKKSDCLIDLFWRYGWLKNPAIWLTENILAHISGTKILSNMEFVQEHRKKNQFLAHFPYFGGKSFSTKSGSVTHNFTWASIGFNFCRLQMQGERKTWCTFSLIYMFCP